MRLGVNNTKSRRIRKKRPANAEKQMLREERKTRVFPGRWRERDLRVVGSWLYWLRLPGEVGAVPRAASASGSGRGREGKGGQGESKIQGVCYSAVTTWKENPAVCSAVWSSWGRSTGITAPEEFMRGAGRAGVGREGRN